MTANQLWQWRALSHDGELQQGVLWAQNREAAFATLMHKNLHPLALKRGRLRHRWQIDHCYAIFQQLATLLQAGLTLSHSLAMLHSSTLCRSGGRYYRLLPTTSAKGVPSLRP
ncbi:type II secretion system F domain-containing protein [Enterobacter cancerogenus]|uniref:Type II secretion system F domain-containing protein n=1 Tax=Enterobacter cancerogenus TaxID=69218 RepID=A0A484WT78_9ENTR|nr:type II secretion system F domain-containing protein [Enterobacter cancerogenus]